MTRDVCHRQACGCCRRLARKLDALAEQVRRLVAQLERAIGPAGKVQLAPLPPTLGPGLPSLGLVDAAILQGLHKAHPRRVLIRCLPAFGAVHDQNTLRRSSKFLESAGLIHRPAGKRGGLALTALGNQFVNSLLFQG